MGQPITVVAKPAVTPGVLRLETNRSLTGMGHERYRGRVLAVYTFAGWTVFVWATRARNIAEDGGSTLNLVVALGLAALGVAVAVAARRGGLAPVLAVAVGATVVAWAVRVPQILLDPQHGLAFQALSLIHI